MIDDILTLIFISMIVFIITYIIISFIKWRKQLKKLASEIKVGDTYRTSVYSDNPFEGTQHWDVEIVEIKDGWVSYKWSDGKISYKEKEAFIEYPFKKLEPHER